MGNHSHGSRRKIFSGTVASPNTEAFDLNAMVTDVSSDNQIDQEESTTLDAADNGGAKSFLYGNNGSTLELTHNYDKDGELLFHFEDIKAAGVEDEDFNITVFDYPSGKITGRPVISRPCKLLNYRDAGGINAKNAGSSSWQRSGEATTGVVA